jgi:YHS domain-containing protein
MFIKLLILIIAAVVVYRAVKSRLGGQPHQKVRSTGAKPLRADDVMIQDPQCGIYFARRQGVVLQQDGRDVYFCSDTCKEKYLAKHQK